jgi:CubicO group peptidase (beta-lactamase class C family)
MSGKRLADARRPHLAVHPKCPRRQEGDHLKQLLAHLSGLPQGYASEVAVDRADAVRRILAVPLKQRPGKGFLYSNENYQLAGAIVEIVSKMSYGDFVRTQLFDPVGLKDTGQVVRGRHPAVAPTLRPISERLMQRHWGQTGFYSTTGDLIRWYTAVRSGKVVSPNSGKQLFDPVTPIQEGSAALGWFHGKTGLGTQLIFSRGNEDFGANSLVYAYPDTDTVIVVLTHAGDKKGAGSYSRVVKGQIERILAL